MMKTYILFISLFVFVNGEDWPSTPKSRIKREAVGALHIVTNNAETIHADVKGEVSSDAPSTDKSCPTDPRPSHVEPGVVFQVTPPEDALKPYAIKSLRKSLPPYPTTLELVRSISRVVTLTVLFVSAICEFYPSFVNLWSTIYNFVVPK